MLSRRPEVVSHVMFQARHYGGRTYPGQVQAAARSRDQEGGHRCLKASLVRFGEHASDVRLDGRSYVAPFFLRLEAWPRVRWGSTLLYIPAEELRFA